MIPRTLLIAAGAFDGLAAETVGSAIARGVGAGGWPADVCPIVPDGERQMTLDNMGLTQSFTIMAYLENGTVSDCDGEILVALQSGHRPTADYVARLREELPRRFPDCTFFFQPADITSQILNFGLPAPIDIQVVGVNRDGNLAVAQNLRREIAKVPGVADVHLHQMTDRPNLNLDVDRIQASELGLTQQDVSGSVLVSLSSITQVSPNFWVNPDNHVLEVRTTETAKGAAGPEQFRIQIAQPPDFLKQVAVGQPVVVFVGRQAVVHVADAWLIADAVPNVQPPAWRVLQEKGVTPAFVAGHSLGEYSAHVAAGTMSFADAVRTVRSRGKFMQEAVPVGTGSMAAILGMAPEAVASVCSDAAQGEVCEPANINSPEQIVISGHVAAVERAVKLADDRA